MALALTVNTYTMDGNQSLSFITSTHVESDLGRAQEEFHMLAVRLQELPPDHAIFEETAFTDEAMDKLVSLGSWRSHKMHGLYKETRNNSICLQVCINDIELSAPVAAQNPSVPPPNIGSTAPSPPVVQMSQTDGVIGVVQGS